MFFEDVRKVERYAVEVEQSGVCCITCTLNKNGYEICKNVQKCFATAITSDFTEYKHWRPRYTLEDFK